MPRTAKKATTPTTDIVVADAIKQLETTEVDFRLALEEFRPDDFDRVHAISALDFESVAKKIEATKQPQLPAHSEKLETSETPTPQASEPATEKPQNAPIVTSTPQQQIANPTQSPIPNTGLSLVEQLALQAQEEITAVDGVLQVRNALILNTVSVRNAELTENMNQRWQYQKQNYLGTIRDLAALAQTPVEVTSDKTDLTAEIDGIISELGKTLAFSSKC